MLEMPAPLKGLGSPKVLQGSGSSWPCGADGSLH